MDCMLQNKVRQSKLAKWLPVQGSRLMKSEVNDEEGCLERTASATVPR